MSTSFTILASWPWYKHWSILTCLIVIPPFSTLYHVNYQIINTIMNKEFSRITLIVGLWWLTIVVPVADSVKFTGIINRFVFRIRASMVCRNLRMKFNNLFIFIVKVLSSCSSVSRELHRFGLYFVQRDHLGKDLIQHLIYY